VLAPSDTGERGLMEEALYGAGAARVLKDLSELWELLP
jgi:hypothetical protein